MSKEKSQQNKKHVTASFDLQQVMYLPKSNMSEVFYKRRLANYNFTIYDIGTKDGHCFLSHEGTTNRGSNEIASYLFSFLEAKDKEGVKEVVMFSDGCPGKKKVRSYQRCLCISYKIQNL